jgi:hypothetical protein
MSTLVDLVENSVTDLNTTHNYLGVLEPILSPLRDNSLNILQVGVLHGGEMQLWDKYFSNAMLYGLDYQTQDVYRVPFFYQDNVKIYAAGRPYDSVYIQENFIDKGLKFDLIFEDISPRNFETQSAALEIYKQLLNPGGMLFILDIQSDYDYHRVKNILPEIEHECCHLIDVRHTRGRWDDMILVYTAPTFDASGNIVSYATETGITFDVSGNVTEVLDSSGNVLETIIGEYSDSDEEYDDVDESNAPTGV